MQYNIHRKSKKVKYKGNKIAWMSQSQGIKQTSVEFPVYCSIYATALKRLKTQALRIAARNQNLYKTQ